MEKIQNDCTATKLTNVNKDKKQWGGLDRTSIIVPHPRIDHYDQPFRHKTL